MPSWSLGIVADSHCILLSFVVTLIDMQNKCTGILKVYLVASPFWCQMSEWSEPCIRSQCQFLNGKHILDKTERNAVFTLRSRIWWKPALRSEWISLAGVYRRLCLHSLLSLFFFSYITYYPKCIAGGMLALAPQYTINGRYHSVDIAARGLESRWPSWNNRHFHPAHKASASPSSIKSSRARWDT